MTWARVDDSANGNAKVMALSDAAFRMWVGGLVYCQANLTDGFIPLHAIHSFNVRKRPASVVLELVRKAIPGKDVLWHPVDGGYQVHDYLIWNDSREDILTAREKARARMDRLRGKEQNSERNAEQNSERNGSGSALVRSSISTPTKDQDHKDRDPDPAPTKALLTLFDELHQGKLNSRAAIDGRKDASILASLCRQRGPAEVERLIRAFFARPDVWVAEHGYSVGIFKTQIPKLLAWTAPKSPKARLSEKVQQLADSAGLATHQAEYLAGAAFTWDRSSGTGTLAIPDPDSAAWVQRNYHEVLEQAVIAKGGSRLVIEVLQTS